MLGCALGAQFKRRSFLMIARKSSAYSSIIRNIPSEGRGSGGTALV